MALPADTIFRVRSGGSDTLCGGGFSIANKGATGVDHSQQDSANHTFTNTLSAVGTTSLTDSGAGFSNTMLGNLIQITGQGVYCITAFTNSSVVTVDRALGTFSTTIGYEGGAFTTIDKANGIVTAGNIISIQAGITLTLTTAIAMANVGGGYLTVQGESGTRPIITSSTNSVNLIEHQGGNSICTFKHLQLTHTAATRGDGMHAKTGNVPVTHIEDCIFDGFRYAINGRFSGDYAYTSLTMDRCEIKNCTTAGISNDGANRLTDCNIHGNTGCGLETETSDQTASHDHVFIRTAFRGNTSHGAYIHHNANRLIVHSCDFSDNSGDGLKMDGATNAFDLVIADSITWGNIGIGLNTPTLPAGSLIGAYNNAIGVMEQIVLLLCQLEIMMLP